MLNVNPPKADKFQMNVKTKIPNLTFELCHLAFSLDPLITSLFFKTSLYKFVTRFTMVCKENS